VDRSPAARPTRCAPAYRLSQWARAARLLVLVVGGAVACAPAAPLRLGTHVAPRPLGRASAEARPRAHPWTTSTGGVIPLWVDSVPGMRGWSPELVALAYSAARAWETPGVPVRFERATGPDAALVRLHWQHEVPWKGGGVTERAVNARGRTSAADCWVVLAPGRGRTARPADELRTVVLHELGHALGLAHDRSVAAVMYDGDRFGAGRAAVSERDRAALRALYAGDAGTESLVAVTPDVVRPRR
jgi:hypothetical protein